MTQNAKSSDEPRLRQRLERLASVSLRGWNQSLEWQEEDRPCNIVVECGWGRLIFAHTFDDPSQLAERICEEASGARDIAFYITDPHVVLSMAPQDLFLDPSHAYRLHLSDYRPARQRPTGFAIRRLRTKEDAQAINDIYAARHMVQVDPVYYWDNRNSRTQTFLVAEDLTSHKVIGCVTGIDHQQSFDDPENGSSLWCLAVHSQAPYPGVGESLVRQLAEHFAARGRAFMDLSVMHDNDQAIALYEKLGFRRIPIFAIKKKNPINENLFIGPPVTEKLNPYAMLIVKEARRRGISVEVLDAQGGFFRLTHGGREITCRESLSQLTDAVAMSRCDDKAVTRRLLALEGLRVPDQQNAGDPENDSAFLARHGSIVVKPARGEQGRGISVDIRDEASLKTAVEFARQHCDTVLLEECVEGMDLRVIVIGHRVVAAAVRKPPQVTGTGRHTVHDLIEAQSRRRAAATGGESRIPLDAETERCIGNAGYGLGDILPSGEVLTVRRTANLHTGGTIHDVTDRLHHRIVEASVQAAKAINIPVVGLDFLVPQVDSADYVIIEANERPGLANHEPQPTAERFIDLLFPQTAVSG